MDMKAYHSASAMVKELADLLTKDIIDSIQERMACHFVVSGGRSPIPVLECLRKVAIPWASVHIYPSDERCLPKGHEKRNDMILEKVLLKHVDLPEQNFHRMPAELGAIEGALAYSSYLESLEGLERFDIALLGVGEDGHIASLFPNHPALLDSRIAVAVENAPKEPASRVSLSLESLKRARNKRVLLLGESKIQALEMVRYSFHVPVNMLESAKVFCAV